MKLLTVIFTTFDSLLQGTPLSVEITFLLYQVSAIRAGGSYVSPVAPDTGLKSVPLVLDCHSYETSPSNTGVTLVNIAASLPSQIIWSEPIAPAVKLLTVTLIAVVGSLQVLPLSADVTRRLNHVSATSAPAKYNSFVSPVIFDQVLPLRLLCHWYVIVPSPLTGSPLANGAGVSPSQIH